MQTSQRRYMIQGSRVYDERRTLPEGHTGTSTPTYSHTNVTRSGRFSDNIVVVVGSVRLLVSVALQLGW